MAIEHYNATTLLCLLTLLLLLLLVFGQEQLFIAFAAPLRPRYQNAALLNHRNSFVEIKIVRCQNVVALLLDLNLEGDENQEYYYQ